MVLARESGKNGSTSWSFHKVEGCQCKQDENPVGEPWVESEQMQALWNMVGVE
jgi:hypothetical protein